MSTSHKLVKPQDTVKILLWVCIHIPVYNFTTLNFKYPQLLIISQTVKHFGTLFVKIFQGVNHLAMGRDSFH